MSLTRFTLAMAPLGTGTLMGISSYIKRNLGRSYQKAIMPDPSQFGLKYCPVSFPSWDGITLKGWWFGTQNNWPVIILLHGIRANRAEPRERVFGIVKELINHGYNVLAFDFRAHGESEGSHISVGYYEKNDLLGAVKFIRQRGVTGKIGVLGFSMGAAISLITAAECKDISAIVADSAFTDIISLIRSKFSRVWYFSMLLIPALNIVTKALYSFDFRKIKPLEAIKLISAPVFIIHGGRDDTVPVEHAYRLRSACRNRLNQLWVVPEANHTDAFAIRTEEYLTRILSFFSKAFALT
jgi:uncharacterized protein